MGKPIHDDDPVLHARVMKDIVAEYEPATDVNDMDTALRLITALRAMSKRAAEENQPIEGEYTAFLDAKCEEKLIQLYDEHNYMFGYSETYWLDPPDLVDAFEDFVKHAIEVHWDMHRDEKEAEEKANKKRSRGRFKSSGNSN